MLRPCITADGYLVRRLRDTIYNYTHAGGEIIAKFRAHSEMRPPLLKRLIESGISCSAATMCGNNTFQSEMSTLQRQNKLLWSKNNANGAWN